MNKMPIVDRLLDLNRENIVSFHVPGHKNGAIYHKVSDRGYGDILPRLYRLDTTEIPGTDNLHKPEDIIRESQERASQLFKSEETFFLVNGSTSGIYSMIMAATSPGDKILVDRNCHQSVINASILGDLTPVYVYPQLDEDLGIALGIWPEDIEEELKKHRDIRAVILTYPSYHGIGYNLKKIREITDKYDKILLIDEAHGAHLGLSKHLPPTALACGADAVVQSTHKTLPSFSQSSMLHIQGDKIDRDKLKFMLRVHQTSSPSYLLLSSLEFAVTIYREEGKQLMEDLLANIGDFREKAKKIRGLNVLGREIIGYKGVHSLDLSRLWLRLKNMPGHRLDKTLRQEFGIQVELSNKQGALALASLANDREDFDKLLGALDRLSRRPGEDEPGQIQGLEGFLEKYTDQLISPREALYRDKRPVALEESQGHISGEYIIPYPPGIPLIIPGERINQSIIRQVKHIIGQGGEILGLQDRRGKTIRVIK